MFPQTAVATTSVAQLTDVKTLLNLDRVTQQIGIIVNTVSSKQIYNLSTAQPDINFAAALGHLHHQGFEISHSRHLLGFLPQDPANAEPRPGQ